MMTTIIIFIPCIMFLFFMIKSDRKFKKDMEQIDDDLARLRESMAQNLNQSINQNTHTMNPITPPTLKTEFRQSLEFKDMIKLGFTQDDAIEALGFDPEKHFLSYDPTIDAKFVRPGDYFSKDSDGNVTNLRVGGYFYDDHHGQFFADVITTNKDSFKNSKRMSLSAIKDLHTALGAIRGKAEDFYKNLGF